MPKRHDGKRVSILATNGFELAELVAPRKALEEAGAQTQVVSPEADRINGWNHTNWGEGVHVDAAFE